MHERVVLSGRAESAFVDPGLAAVRRMCLCVGYVYVKDRQHS